MSPKNNLKAAPKTRLRLKRILLFGAGALVIGAVVWKILFTTVATVASTTDVRAMFTPGTGPVVTGHTWQGTLVVDHTQVADTGDIADFPLLVQITLPELRTTSFGGHAHSPSGHDIVFAGENDMQLDHQLEMYDPTTGSITAWVRLPVLYKNIDTELSVMCGNPNHNSSLSTEDVWNSSYKAVWHMNDNPDIGDIVDYANDYDAQPSNGMNHQNVIMGKIGQAMNFDGNDFCAIKDLHYDTPGEITEFTISAWVQTTYDNNSWTSNWAILDYDRSEKYHLSVHGKGKVSFCTHDAGYQGGGMAVHDQFAGNNGQVNDGQWHHIVATFKDGEKKIYINGALISTQTQLINTIGSNKTRYGFIGDGSEASTFNGSRNNQYYNGKIDELRLINVQRSEGYIQTEFNNQSNPGAFVSVGETGTLPIELGSFDAELDGDVVNIEWLVVTQLNNDYFTIERSLDGLDFESIGTVKGAGTSQQEKTYYFVDERPQIGVNYYRLRQTDFDGKSETFQPVAVKYIPEIETITIDKAYPNPFTDRFKVDYTVTESSYLNFTLVNSNGRTIAGDEVFVSEGQNTYEFYSPEPIPSGLYFFQITQNDSRKATIKVIKR